MATSRDTTQSPYLELPGYSAQSQVASAPVAPKLDYNGYDPSLNGLLLAAGDPATINSTNTTTAGVVQLVRLRAGYTMTLSNVWYGMTTAATAPTLNQCPIGLYGNLVSGNISLISSGADQQGGFNNSNTTRTVPITPVTVVAGADVWVAFIFNGTTSPAFYRLGAQAAACNAGLSASVGAGFRYASFGSALTALPATIALSATTFTSAIWAAAS